MSTVDALRGAHQSFGRQAWGQAHAELVAADHRERLEAEDLERLAVAAYLSGRDDDSDAAWERAHQAFLHRSEVPAAVRCAFWLGVLLVLWGNHPRGGGWLAAPGGSRAEQPPDR